MSDAVPGSNPAREALAEAIYQEFRVGSWDNEPAWLKAKFYEVVDRLIPFFQSVAPKAPESPSAAEADIEAAFQKTWETNPAPYGLVLDAYRHYFRAGAEFARRLLDSPTVAEAKPAEGQADAELKSAFGKVHEYFVQQGWRESAARAEELECDFDNYMRGAYTLDEFFEMAPTLGSGRAQPHLQEAEGRKAVEVCDWTSLDEEGCCWETECGHAFQFNDDGPKENGMSFCGFCGKPIVEYPHNWISDDESTPQENKP